jgi:hypothetical protein
MRPAYLADAFRREGSFRRTACALQGATPPTATPASLRMPRSAASTHPKGHTLKGAGRQAGRQAGDRPMVFSVEMAVDTHTIKTQTVSLGEPVTFEGEDAEQFLREIKDGPSPERIAELRAAVAAAAPDRGRSANEMFR